MYQKTQVIGHLGRDPEMRYTQNGTAVTSFNVATTRKWTSANGEQQEKTTWFRVSCWGKLAETTAQYLQKGRLVFVEGEIEASAWTDKEGAPRASLELRAFTVKFLSGRVDGAEAGAGGVAPGGDDFAVHEDDIPF